MTLEPAWWLAGVMLGLAVAGIAGFWMLVLPWWIPLAVTLAACLLLSRDLTRHAFLRHSGSIRQLRWLPDGRWELVYVDGARAQARLQPGSIQLHWLQLLNFELINKPAGWRQRSLLLSPDRAPAALRMALRRRLTVAGLKPPESV